MAKLRTPSWAAIGAVAFGLAMLVSGLILSHKAYAITVCQIFSGCTGTSTAPAYGQVLIGGRNGEYELVASTTFANASGVTSVFGRTGIVTAQNGDYTTSLVPEGSNLYYTSARALSSFITNLAATTSVASITTLPNLSLPYTQLTGAPAALSLTTIGSSGAATYNPGSGILNIPVYSGTTYTGTYPISVSGSVISFLGLGTTTTPVIGNIPYFSTLTGFANVATSSFTPSGEFTTTGTIGALVGGSASTLSLANNGIVLGKIAQIGANTLLGNQTGGSGNVTALSTSTLSIGGTAANVTGIVAVGNGGTGASSLPADSVLYTNHAASAVTGIGTTTTAAGTGIAFSGATFGVGGSANTISFASIAANSLWVNKTGATAVPAVLATSSLGVALSDTTGTLAVNRGGTGVASFTSSQLLYGNGTNALSSVGTTTFTPNAEFTTTGTVGALVGGSASTLAITVNGVAYSKLNQAGANTILGNNTGATANVVAFATSSLGIALSDTTGTLAIARGGTNATSFSNNQPVIFDGTRLVSSSTLAVAVGGTGSSTLTGLLKGNGTSGLLTAIAGTDYIVGSGTSGNCTKWLANNTIGDAGAACGTSGGVASIGPAGQLQTGPNVTLATSSTAYQGLTASTTITATGNLITFANTLAGILGVGGGGTGLASVGDGQLVFGGPGGGTANLTALATSTAGFLTDSYATGRPVWAATSTLNVNLGDTVGTLAVNRGGTGQVSFTSGNLIYGAGSGALQNVATSTLSVGGGISVTSGTLGAMVGGSAPTIGIATNALALSQLNTIGANTILGNQTGGTANVVALSTSTLSIGGTASNITGLLATANGGTNNASLPGDVILYTNHTGSQVIGVATSSATLAISGTALGGTLPGLSHDATLTGTTYNGTAAVSNLGIDLTHANTWTGAITANNGATTTNLYVTASAGVGSSTPWATLSVNGPWNGTAPLFAVGSTTLTGTSTALILTKNGAFAIGTSSPISNLQLTAADANTSINNLISTALTVVNTDVTANNTSCLQLFSNDTVGNMRGGSKICSQFTARSSGNIVSDLIFGTTAGSGTITQQAVIKSGGQFGIGTTSPYAQLSVSTPGSPLSALFTVASSNNATLFTILGNGSIGIGSSSPMFSLSIGNGTATSSAIITEYAYGAPGNIATGTAYTFGPRLESNHVLWPIGTTGTTFTLCMVPGQTLTIRVQNPNGASAGAITWAACSPQQLYWPNKTTPTQTTTQKDYDVYSFIASGTVASTTASTTIISGTQAPNF